jgi:eukaryotic-like serine/threonine-protein kinase
MPEWKVPGYTELKGIGSGGFGQVVLARHDATGTLVAIKYLRDELLADREFAEMFRGEATLLGSLNDPNIVRLYEYVESPSGAAIVMELVGGVPLREILSYQGKTSAEAALVVLQGSLLGLAAAHRRGIVHRDYKPENVLVNGDGVSKLTDFGIAARADDRPVPAGTLRYAAPEQMVGAPATPASDIYAATATFFECLTGRPPFSGEADDLLRQHRDEPVPLDQVPEPLRPLVTAGMAKDPLGRPADATAFVASLKTAASGAYGRAWEKRGRSHLGEAALLLAALWPSGAPPVTQGTSVYRVPLRRRARSWHVSPVKAVIAVGIAIIAGAAAATALAVSASQRPTDNVRPEAVVQPISLRPSPNPSPTTGPAPSRTASSGPATSRGGTVPLGPVRSTTEFVSQPPTTRSSTIRVSSPPVSSPPVSSPPVSSPPVSSPPVSSPPVSSPPVSSPPVSSPPPVQVAVPAVPSVTATADGSYQITVQWTDSSPGITGFYIDNGCPAGACGQADVEEYKTLGLVYSTTFAATPGDYECYHVAAISSAGESALSSWACLTTPGLTLPGATQWLDTGVSLNAGDGFGIRASGTIYINPALTAESPDGDPNCTQAGGPAAATEFPDPDATCYSLIGRIGDGTPFEIGSAAQLVAATAGELYIEINDNYYPDNTGSWDVRIKKGGSLPP